MLIRSEPLTDTERVRFLTEFKTGFGHSPRPIRQAFPIILKQFSGAIGTPIDIKLNRRDWLLAKESSFGPSRNDRSRTNEESSATVCRNIRRDFLTTGESHANPEIYPSTIDLWQIDHSFKHADEKRSPKHVLIQTFVTIGIVGIFQMHRPHDGNTRAVCRVRRRIYVWK